ncbi:unnamed protein product [Urochloa humidicola]
MSPSVEKKDASPHVGCVPEGILSDVKNNVPDARGNDFLLAGEKKHASSLSMFRRRRALASTHLRCSRSVLRWLCPKGNSLSGCEADDLERKATK